MLEHDLIKIEEENFTVKVININEAEQINNNDKVTTQNDEMDLVEIDDKSLISKVEKIEVESTASGPLSKNSPAHNRSLRNNQKSNNDSNSLIDLTSLEQSNDSDQSKVVDEALLQPLATDQTDQSDNTQHCGNISAYYQNHIIGFNCNFCDLKYGKINHFKRHLLEVHKMLNMVEDLVPENAPRSLRKRMGNKQPQQQAAPVALTLTIGVDEPFDCCGNVFILNAKDLLMACSCCDYETFSEFLFEKHVREKHKIYERPPIKSEPSTETYESERELIIKPEDIKSDKELDLETFEPQEIKRLATKRKASTIESDINPPDVFTITEIKSEADIEPTQSQNKRRTSSIPTRTRGRGRTRLATRQETDVTLSILEEPFPVQLTCGDEDGDEDFDDNEDESILKPIGDKRKKRTYKDKNYRCLYCDLTYVYKSELKIHMRIHSEHRPHKCSQCNKGFVRNSDLKIHYRIHTGEKPFVCDICNTCFRAKQNLTVHRKAHMGEAFRTFECEFCDKKFMRNNDRAIHIRSHTGEKPYKCDICQRGFSSKFNVQAHKSRNHSKHGKRPKGQKPGPKAKPLADELSRQKKLIEKLQNQLLEQIKTDEKISKTGDDSTQDDSSKSTTPATSHDQLKNAYDLLNQITTTVMPLLNL